MKATVSVTYTADIELGDVPSYFLQAGLEADTGEFSIFEFKEPVSVASVEIEVAK